jgi:hypothetical protein
MNCIIDILCYQKKPIYVVGFGIFGTLESGIDVAPAINVASGKVDKKNKDSPLKFANLCYSRI